MYKLYEYRYETEESPWGSNSGTVMQYITNNADEVLYSNLNDSVWNKTICELIKDDPRLTLKKTLTKRQFESIVFIDAV